MSIVAASPRMTTSAAKSAATADLMNLYAQIEIATTPSDVLGLPYTNSRHPKDITTAYHTIARRIHPDKCQTGQKELHTRLFQKVQNAYEHLINSQNQFGGESKSPAESHSTTNPQNENKGPTYSAEPFPRAAFNTEHFPSAAYTNGNGSPEGSYVPRPSSFFSTSAPGSTSSTGRFPGVNRAPSSRAPTPQRAYPRSSCWLDEELLEDL